MRITSVITSYSIHYTKLYDIITVVKLYRKITYHSSVIIQNAVCFHVITSYSIHYTKLYDADTSALGSVLIPNMIKKGYSDYERLISQELIYTGIVRTPVMAIADCIEDQGREVGLMAEYRNNFV